MVLFLNLDLKEFGRGAALGVWTLLLVSELGFNSEVLPVLEAIQVPRAGSCM